MKKLSFVLVLGLLALSTNCSTIQVGVTSNQKEIKSLRKIAIFPLEIEDKNVNKEFTDALALHFLQTDRIEVLERNQKYINKILEEQNFARSGLIDQDSAAKMGKFLGVDGIVLGRAKLLVVPPKKDEAGKIIQTYPKDRIDTFSLKLINVESGTIIVNLRKKSGIEWDWLLRLKRIFGLGYVWDSKDLLVQSSEVDYLADKAVDKMDAGISQVLAKQKK
ncbi:MAG: CsgG/HfaB family protein [Spirochaetota bacterium]